MENIKTVFVLIGNILLAFGVNLSMLLRMQKYILKNKNNNVTGDNLFVYETISFMEKYHIRERLGRGERHRMPKAPKRHEIKYCWIMFFFTLFYLICSLIAGFGFLNIAGLLFVWVVSSVIIDRLEKKKNRWFCTLVRIVVVFLSIIVIFISQLGELFPQSEKIIRFINENHIIYEGSDELFIGQFVILWIPAISLIGILLYSLVKRRIYSLGLVLMTCICTALVYLFIMEKDLAYCYILAFVAYFYITMLIFMKIYNVRALKKIRVIR